MQKLLLIGAALGLVASSLPARADDEVPSLPAYVEADIGHASLDRGSVSLAGASSSGISGTATSGTPGARSSANMMRSVTRSITNDRRDCAGPIPTQLLSHVVCGSQEWSVTAGACTALFTGRHSPFRRPFARPPTPTSVV